MKIRCTHEKGHPDWCGNWRKVHPFTDQDTFTCNVHGNVRNILPEKDLTGIGQKKEEKPQLDMNNPVHKAWATKEAPVIIKDEHITTVFITGRYNGPDKETDAGIKILVHGKYDLVGYDDPKLAVNHAWEIFLSDPDHPSMVAINHALIRMAGGAKHYFNIVFDHDGVPRWQLVTKEVTKQYILVTNWAKCPRCSGKGEVSYGNWSRYDSRLHSSVRTCFHCHGTGYRGAQG
jgi:hypothetical protein